MSLEDEIRRIVREELAKQKPANDDAPEMLTVDEYARRWSLSPSTIRHAIRDKRLDVERVGRAIRIAADAKIGPAKATANDRAILKFMTGGRVR